MTSQLRTTAPRDCHSSAQLRPPPKGFAVQGHCLQVRLHGSRGGVFIGHRPPRDPGGPLQIRSFTSIQMVYTHTHTHPAGAGSTLKGKRKKKSEHRRRAEGQNSAGGEGNKRTSKTNLHGETDLTKTAHTPKPHDTLRRGTRGKN